MSRLSAFGKARFLGGLPVAGLVAVAAGCGGAIVAGGPVYLEAVEYDHYFYDDARSVGKTDIASAEALSNEIERLATTSWRIARANLIAAGKDAVPLLIANLDRPERTHVSLRPVPGPTTPEPHASWTLGQVAGSVLTELVGDYGNAAGSDLPPVDKQGWEAWWRANRRNFVAYTAEGAVPQHVREQKAAEQAKMQEKYPDLDATVKKMLEKRAAREREKEKALRAREIMLLEKKRQAEQQQQ